MKGRRWTLSIAFACCLATSSAFGQWTPYQARPPVWGSLGAGSSPACNDETRNPPGDPQSFYASIGGDKLADSVVRVSIGDSNGHGSLGSGTVIETFDDGSGLVVTNSHIVANAASESSGSVTYRDGRQSRLTIRDADPVWDLAIVEVTVPAGLSAVEVAEQSPQRGESLMIAGYGEPLMVNERPLPPAANLKFQLGQFTKRVAPRIGYPLDQLSIRPCQARQGDSGGPVFDRSGKLAACLWGASSGETVATPCTRIRALLDRVRQRLGRRPRGPVVQSPPVLPGPAPLSPSNQNSPIASPSSPPAAAAPPATDPSGSNAGGELAAIRRRMQELEERLIKQAGAPPLPIVEDGKAVVGQIVEQEGKKLAGEAVQAAAPGLLSKLLPFALTALGGLTGFGLPIGGAAAGLFVVGKLALGAKRFVSSRIAARKAAQQGRIAGMTPAGGKDAPSFSAADLTALAAKIRADLLAQLEGQFAAASVSTSVSASSPPTPAPQFVPTQVDDPNFVALERALEKFGGLSGQNAGLTRMIYSFRDQLLNQAKPA
jgi:hypothetical protein